jgi:hypothetical protein
MADVLAYEPLLIALIVVAGLIYIHVTKVQNCETFVTKLR